MLERRLQPVAGPSSATVPVKYACGARAATSVWPGRGAWPVLARAIKISNSTKSCTAPTGAGVPRPSPAETRREPTSDVGRGSWHARVRTTLDTQCGSSSFVLRAGDRIGRTHPTSVITCDVPLVRALCAFNPRQEHDRLESGRRKLTDTTCHTRVKSARRSEESAVWDRSYMCMYMCHPVQYHVKRKHRTIGLALL